jgi:hypothetical protein
MLVVKGDSMLRSLSLILQKLIPDLKETAGT